MKKLRIAIDAMGGDHAPVNEVSGAILSLRETNNRFQIDLFGDETLIKAEIKKQNAEKLSIEVHHTKSVIDMNDSPVTAIKQKSDSSLSHAMMSLKNGETNAVINTGNTGATTAAAILILGRIPGVSRPTIAAPLPTSFGPVLLTDIGSVVDCRAQFLVEFALMAGIYSERIFKRTRPRIALLNIGSEEGKGNELAKETFERLKKIGNEINFIGNIESKDILKFKADVIVCDGFVGNSILKFAEGMVSVLKERFKNYAEKNFINKLLMGVAQFPLKKVFGDLNYEDVGGVPLLGVNGVVIIGHGRSSPKAIKNMILRAEETSLQNLPKIIEETLSRYQNE